MERKEYRFNEVIFNENEDQRWMYSICEGSVHIYSGYGSAGAEKLATLTKGQFFGEIGMIAMLPRTASAVAADDHVVLELIGQEDFEAYLKEHPENLQSVMSSVSRRIRELTEELSVITQTTREALRQRDLGNTAPGWLTGFVNKLLGKLKERKHAGEEYAIAGRRRQALSGQAPYVIRFYEGDVIFRAGEEADCMYEIYDGSVDIYSDYRTENEKLLTQLSAGEVFGEMGLLDNLPRSATAVCRTESVILLVKPESFMQFFQDKPAKVLWILQQMCIQLRNLTNIYLEVCRTLQQLPAPESRDYSEDVVLAQLEQLRQSQLGMDMYDPYGRADWMYERF